MKKGVNQSNVFLTMAIICTLLTVSILPVALAADTKHIKSFDKGPSYKPVAPVKKITMVNFDEETYLDDYAYLAAVPTSVFNNEDKLFSHPLLFYQDECESDDERELPINARKGIDYFMEDWMSYCNGQLDQMTLINVPKNNLDSSWKSKEYSIIDADDPYELASRLALSEWSYSDNAVVAVIDEEFEKLNEKFSGEISGTLVVDKDIKTKHFEVPHTNKLNPIPNDFYVPEGYEYIDVRCWYPCISWKLGVPLPGLEGLAQVTLPAGDKDLQLYCLFDDEDLETTEWMQVFALDEWNQKHGMDHEKGGTYVYRHGKWRATVTDIPTKDGNEKKLQIYGSIIDVLKSFREVIYQVDINMYPGDKITLWEDIPFDCCDVEIEMTWDTPNINLGFCLIGPGGEKLFSDDEGVIRINRIGQCLPGESYDLAIYTIDGTKGSFDYEISYEWTQNDTEYRADCLTDAVEGAVLSSTLNAPLLYTSSTKLSNSTASALYKLGVENIYLVNIGGHLSKEVENELKGISSAIKHYKTHKDIYELIQKRTNSNSIVFSTIRSWTPWFVAEQKPTDEISMPGALHVGPAAYIAAHHGTPVIIVEDHPRLSSAVTWHTEFWRRHGKGNVYPSVSEMYLTGKRVYSFLDDFGFDKKGLETMITVADQYDIGIPWDRVFVGAAKPGRFCGSPVDTSYWISRNMFYPALIFENPALDGGISLINGSKSHRRAILPWGKGGLKIDRPSQEENFNYPVLASLIGHKYRLNEYMEKYYGMRYQCADGIIPGTTNSFEAIDDGTLVMSTGEQGQFWPDMSTTEIVPFYLNRGGYDTAFTTSFDATINNLNQGVIMWIVNSHGANSDSGILLFWDPNNEATSEEAMTGYPGLPLVGATKEPNPWRAYDWYLGSTDDPDTLTSDVYGIIPALLGNPNPKLPYIFRTAIDWAPAKKPIMDKIGNLLSVIPIIKRLSPDWIKETEDYHDGLIISSLLSKFGCSWYKGTAFDENLKNIHSTGLVFSPCLLAGKYFHITMVRHGSAYQVIDPWATSWYSSFYLETIPRDIALGNTVGEAYTNGIKHVGILYLNGGGSNGDKPQWWWDMHENVCFYGDPDLRQFVPGVEYSNANYWERDDVQPIRYDEKLSVDGHMPFGAVDYPHEKEPVTLLQQYFWVILALVLIIILLITARLLGRKQNSRQ